MTNYLNLSIGAKMRLSILRNSAKNGKWVNPMTWRNCRFANFKNISTCDQGFNGKTPVWYAFGQMFKRENDAHIIAKLDHTGWYCDVDQQDLAIGIVAKLPHGRYIAGYRLTMNGERVYFPEIFTDEIDAAKMADEHARVIGEQEQEHAQKWNDAREIEITIEDSFARLKECLVLRHVACMDYVRDEIHELIETIRNSRETLKTEYAGVL